MAEHCAKCAAQRHHGYGHQKRSQSRRTSVSHPAGSDRTTRDGNQQPQRQPGDSASCRTQTHASEQVFAITHLDPPSGDHAREKRDETEQEHPARELPRRWKRGKDRQAWNLTQLGTCQVDAGVSAERETRADQSRSGPQDEGRYRKQAPDRESQAAAESRIEHGPEVAGARDMKDEQCQNDRRGRRQDSDDRRD